MIQANKIQPRAVCLACLVASFFVAPRAEAFLNAGVEAGVVKRTASDPNNLNLGLGIGAHAELTFADTFALGGYYLHSKNPITGTASSSEADCIFDTWGIRGRLILPMPGRTKPYALLGLGHTWANYESHGLTQTKGESWEVPIGFGVAHKFLGLFQFSLEGAYRPSFSFSGDAYTQAGIRQPKGGWSALAGLALDI